MSKDINSAFDQIESQKLTSVDFVKRFEKFVSDIDMKFIGNQKSFKTI